MRRMILGIIVVCLLATLVFVRASSRNVGASSSSSNLPVYASDGTLALPANYREWVFLTSGFGMNYSAGMNHQEMFTNVFVAPEAYQGFNSTGKWPDKSMFVVEIYSPASHGSINKAGHYQDTFAGLDVEVKDSSSIMSSSPALHRRSLWPAAPAINVITTTARWNIPSFSFTQRCWIFRSTRVWSSPRSTFP